MFCQIVPALTWIKKALEKTFFLLSSSASERGRDRVKLRLVMKPSVFDATCHHQFLTIKMCFMKYIIICIMSWTETNSIKSKIKICAATAKRIQTSSLSKFECQFLLCVYMAWRLLYQDMMAIIIGEKTISILAGNFNTCQLYYSCMVVMKHFLKWLGGD